MTHIVGPEEFELSDLNGTNGFVLNGIDVNDESGFSVSGAGDINGDGIDDILIGAHAAENSGGPWADSGESYVVFGSSSGFAATFELSSLNGSNGFVLNGIDAGDSSGFSISAAGDVNGDGIDDFVIGARSVGPGESYVVFGSTAGFGASLELSSLNGSNGFVMTGIDGGDGAGFSVSGAGDINGDGVDDLIIGAYLADPNGTQSGESYVVFGSSIGFAASFELSALNGSNGFVINGIDALDGSGGSVSAAGDINGDGIDDIIIGATGANPSGLFSGESYVVFGSSAGFAATLELSALSGSNGFVINGVNADDWSGISVSAAGDINGDGIDDLIIGAPYADPNGIQSGASYVVFGSTASFAASLELSALNGSNGFVLNGTRVERVGHSVAAAGDINGDGIDDLIIGAMGAYPNQSGSGESYIVFGSTAGFAAAFELSVLDGFNGFVVNAN